MNQLPKTRVIDGAGQKVGNRFFIYDKALDNLHCLNITAARLYMACRQKISFEEFKAETNLSNEDIFLALDDLKRENLLENNAELEKSRFESGI